jgi:hypothetical protein
MTFDRYRAIPAVNWSTLKHLYVDRAPVTDDRLCIVSPLRYKFFKEQPEATVETDAMRLGKLTHTAVFEPDRLPLEYVVCACEDKRLKAHQACKLAAEGRTLVSESAYGKALAIRDAVRTHPIASWYLRDGEAERTIQWTDQATGLACKGRLDWLSHTGGCVVDLKTTNDIGERVFRATCEKLGHFRQLAMYCAGAAACDLLVPPVRAVIIAVENKPPHEVAVYAVEADSLASAGAEVDELLSVLKACKEADKWPGRFETEQLLRRPDWVMGEPEIAFEE